MPPSPPLPLLDEHKHITLTFINQFHVAFFSQYIAKNVDLNNTYEKDMPCDEENERTEIMKKSSTKQTREVHSVFKDGRKLSDGSAILRSGMSH